MYKNRFDNIKTVSIQYGTTIAFVTKSGTVMGEHCIRQIDDENGKRVVIAYNLTPAAARSLSKKTHSAKDDDRRPYYLLDLGTFCPHIPVSYTHLTLPTTAIVPIPATLPAVSRRTPIKRCWPLLGMPVRLRLLFPRMGAST